MKEMCCKTFFSTIKLIYFVKYFYYFQIIFIKFWNSHISPAPPSPCCRSCWPPCWSPGPGGRARPRASPAGTGGPAAAASSRWSCSAWAGCTAARPWTRKSFLGCSCPVEGDMLGLSLQSTLHVPPSTPCDRPCRYFSSWAAPLPAFHSSLVAPFLASPSHSYSPATRPIKWRQ